MISVIIPVYNAEKYISKCIDSIIKQTYKDLEILLVDDGSSDNSGSICDHYKEIDSRIKVIHKKNEGAAIARNIGIQESTGEYISFVDSDDLVHPQMLELLYNSLSKNDADVAVCDISETPFDLSSTEVINSEKIISSTEEFLDELAHQNLLYIVIWNKLYTRKILENVSFPEGKKYEDLWFSANFFSLVNKAVFINNKLYYYYQRDNSLSKEVISEKNIIDQIEAMENACVVMKEHGCFESQKEMARHVSNTIINHYSNISKYHLNNEIKMKKILHNIFKREMKLNKNVFSIRQVVYNSFLVCPMLGVWLKKIRK